MRRSWLVLAAVIGLGTGTLLAGTAPPQTEGPPAPPKPVDGMLCVGENSVESPALEGVPGDKPAAERVDVLPCPVNFSNCNDVPGRSCTLQDCVTVDLDITRCQKPNGQILHCTGGTTLHKTTCDCQEQFHDQCCDLGTCQWGDCGICTGGSLSTFCQ